MWVSLGQSYGIATSAMLGWRPSVFLTPLCFIEEPTMVHAPPSTFKAHRSHFVHLDPIPVRHLLIASVLLQPVLKRVPDELALAQCGHVC